MAEPAENAEPVVESDTPQPVIETPETPEPAPQKPVMVPVAVVADLREKKRGLESELESTRRELAEAKALSERLQRGEKTLVEHAPPQSQPWQPPKPTEDVERAAAQLVVNRDIQNVNEQGMRDYGSQWNDTVNALSAFGVNNPEFIVDVIEIDRANAARIMHDIAQDGERAVALANMSKARRIAEIARMTTSTEPARGPDGKFAPQKEQPKQVSKAPAPPPPVSPSATKDVDWRADDATDEQFSRGFDEMMERRSKHGRR
jgi:hypothetical protein